MRKPVTRTRGLFDELIADADAVTAPPWELAEFPILDGIDEISIDFETDGLKWWGESKPIGFAVEWAGQTRYFSWGHRSDAPRHDEETAKRWFREQLKGKRIANAGVKTEVHFAREWLGYSLEDLGCRVTDIQYLAALLDDHRKTFSQEALCEEFLRDERKITTVNGVTIDPTKMAWHHPGIVAVRAEADVRQVRKLMQVFEPMIAEQGLSKVLTLEEECTWATCEMERNAALIDVEKLRRWTKECRTEYERLLMEIWKRTQIRFNPDSGVDWNKLFRARGLENLEMTTSEKPRKSFTDAILQNTIRETEDEVIAMGRRAGKLADLLSKYLDKWAATVGDDGLLRFNLHQLRSDEGGTVSGRFASAAIDVGKGARVGTNVQAILALEKQRDLYGPEWIIRELLIAKDGERVISADAEQIEYRLFAHLAANPRILKAYEEDPRLSFHKLVHGYLLPLRPNLGYKSLKNINFMQIYGGGLVKLAQMLGEISLSEANELNAMDSAARTKTKNLPVDLPSRKDPRMKSTLEIKEIYDRELPEVKPMTRQATDRAVEYGYVTTLMGRRSRFPRNPDGTVVKPHKALNARIQGSAGDILKTKMIEVHKARHRLGFTPRLTVHDQLVGDGQSETAKALSEVLDSQSFKLKVPILWAVSTGATLKECDEK